MPKVSVLMPIYNTKEEYLREAIDSILKQTYSDLELVIVDDGSEKFIEEIITSYNDERIKYLKLSCNQGISNARNFGLKQCEGKYIAFMDSDDISLPQRLEKQVNFLEKNPKIGCLGTQYKTLKGKKQILSLRPIQNEEIEKYLLFKGCIFCQSSVMIKKEIIENYNLLYKQEDFPAEDYAFWLNLIGKTQFAILDELLLLYRYYDGNVSTKHKNIQNKKAFFLQLTALENYFNISFKEKEKLCDIYDLIICTPEEEIEIYNVIRENLRILKNHQYLFKNIESMLLKRLKSLYSHEHTICGQYKLFKSPINQLLPLSLSKRLWFFITRGVI